MSIGIIWLALIVLVPLLVLYLLRVNAAPVFLALCLGYVLLTFDSHNAYSLTAHAPVHVNANSLIVNLALLLGPAVLTLLFEIKKIHGNQKYFNLLPSLAVGLFAALLIVPLLPTATMRAVTSTGYWHSIANYQASIVGLGAALALVFFWLSLRHESGKKHHGKAKD